MTGRPGSCCPPSLPPRGRSAEVLRRLARFPSFEETADSRHVSPLSAIRRLLATLNNPEENYRIVHVAGTDGKGLTAAMIAAILHRDGYRTGLYTSPQVCDVREGIQIDGEWIAEDDFTRVAGTVLRAASGDVHLSQFDLRTAIALLAFSELGVDWAVVEAGLGGRFDSTNVTDKALAVVTAIDYDHTALLGDSLVEIADHKIGILRPGVPVVVARQKPGLLALLDEKASSEGSYVFAAAALAIRPSGAGLYELRWPDGEVTPARIGERVPADVYLESLRTALVSRQVLGAGSPASWAEAALAVSLPGRLEYRERVTWQGCSVPVARMVLDGCHSPGAVRACAQQLAAWHMDDYTLVLGLAGDKLTDRLRQPLADLCRPAHAIVLTSFDFPRAAAPPALAEFLRDADPVLGPRLRTAGSVSEAMRAACAEPRRPVVVAGSLYLIRDVLSGLEGRGTGIS